MRIGAAWLVISLMLTVVVGCGGGGGKGGGPGNPILFEKSLEMTSAGGEIADVARGIRLFVPAGTLKGSSTVTLQTFRDQRKEAQREGFTANPNAISIGIDASAMTDGSAVKIEIPSTVPFDQYRTMMFVTDGIGSYLPLDVTYDVDRKLVVGAAHKGRLAALAASKEANTPMAVGAVLWIAHEVDAEASCSLEDCTGDGETTRAAHRTAGTRIAVVVNGIFDGPQDVQALVQRLSQVTALGNGGQILYRRVYKLRYRWEAHIDASGEQLASLLRPLVGNGTTVDLFGHSMGGLVARWAVEKTDLGRNVGFLFTLGTPHDGVPLRVVQCLLGPGVELVASAFYPSLRDLVDQQVEVPGSPSFLKRLNDGDSPYRTTARYYTLAGTNWRTYGTKGRLIEFLYNPPVIPRTIDHDGIVPLYSACSDLLSRKSLAWHDKRAEHTWQTDANHTQLKDPAKVGDQIARWLQTGEAEYSVVDLHPEGFDSSSLYGISEGKIIGIGARDGHGHALLWHSASSTAVDITPAGCERFMGLATSADQQAGSAENIAFHNGGRHALLWTGSAQSVVDLHPAGAGGSMAEGVSGGHQVGLFWQQGEEGHACLWSGSASSLVDLNPSWCSTSSARGVFGGKQVGEGWTAQGQHAVLWSGSADSAVDLHPPGAYMSSGSAMHEDTQVGTAVIGNKDHAFLWRGTAASAVDLHPSGFDSSIARAVAGPWQAGYGEAGGTRHALVWHGTASSMVDLHASLPAGYTYSSAVGVDVDGTVAGTAVGPDGVAHAVLWVPAGRAVRSGQAARATTQTAPPKPGARR